MPYVSLGCSLGLVVLQCTPNFFVSVLFRSKLKCIKKMNSFPPSSQPQAKKKSGLLQFLFPSLKGAKKSCIVFNAESPNHDAFFSARVSLNGSVWSIADYSPGPGTGNAF